MKLILHCLILARKNSMICLEKHDEQLLVVEILLDDELLVDIQVPDFEVSKICFDDELDQVELNLQDLISI